MRDNPKPMQRYRHFKGNLYQVLYLAKDSETLQDVVVYQALYGDYQIYVRPLEMFMSEVDKQKYPDVSQTYRFEQVCAGKEDEAPTTIQADGKSVENTDTQMGSTKTEEHISKVGSSQADNVSDTMQQEEFELDPAVAEFLDADTYEKKLNILASIRHRITDEMINTMAIATDIEVDEGPVEKRYEQLKYCLVTKEKYECVRIRS